MMQNAFSHDKVVRSLEKLEIIEFLSRVSTGLNLEPYGQAHREKRVKILFGAEVSLANTNLEISQD